MWGHRANYWPLNWRNTQEDEENDNSQSWIPAPQQTLAWELVLEEDNLTCGFWRLSGDNSERNCRLPHHWGHFHTPGTLSDSQGEYQWPSPGTLAGRGGSGQFGKASEHSFLTRLHSGETNYPEPNLLGFYESLDLGEYKCPTPAPFQPSSPI